MLRLDLATTSGSAVAFLFRTWCFLRDAGPGRRPEAAELAYAVEDMAVGLGLDPAGPPCASRAGWHGRGVHRLRAAVDRADALLMAGLIPDEHAAAAVELDGDELDFSRWPTPSALSPGTQPPGPRGCRSMAGTLG
jgi:hypothetical protein